jgi:histidinol-phosphatase
MARTPTEWLSFLVECADLADDISRHYFKSGQLHCVTKKNKSFVTDADLEVETKLRELAKDKHPELAVLGEEFGVCVEAAPLKFVIDPIDGTANFLRGIPLYASLLAIEQNGEIVAGVVSAPSTNERWWASAGNGAFYNGELMTVSKVDKLEEAQSFYGGLFGLEADGRPDGLMALLKKTYRQRGFGDYYAHCLVAMGCGEFAVDYGLSPWDVAPLLILIKEAGGTATDLTGPAGLYSKIFITTNKRLEPMVLDHLSLVSTPSE